MESGATSTETLTGIWTGTSYGSFIVSYSEIDIEV